MHCPDTSLNRSLRLPARTRLITWIVSFLIFWMRVCICLHWLIKIGWRGDQSRRLNGGKSALQKKDVPKTCVATDGGPKQGAVCSNSSGGGGGNLRWRVDNATRKHTRTRHLGSCSLTRAHADIQTHTWTLLCARKYTYIDIDANTNTHTSFRTRTNTYVH